MVLHEEIVFAFPLEVKALCIHKLEIAYLNKMKLVCKKEIQLNQFLLSFSQNTF